MKSFFLSVIVLSFFTFSACEDKDIATPATPSTWELIETLADPGDGSGTFQPVKSERRLNLLADGTYTAEGDICSFSTEGDTQSTGVYDISRGTIFPNECGTIGGTPLQLSISGDVLTIGYLCFEPCEHRYRRVR